MSKQIHKGAAVPTFLDELISARGSKVDVDARLDVALNEDGIFGQQAILDEVITARDGEASLVDRITEIVQVVSSLTSGVATTTASWVDDDTIPQNTEGAEFMSQSITPKDAGNTLIIIAIVYCHISATAVRQAALFKDSEANARAATSGLTSGALTAGPLVMIFSLAAGSTSPTTFKVRGGTDAAGTFTFNGVSSTRVYGTAIKSSLTIIELRG